MSDICPAASVLLTRGPGSREVLAVRRAEALRFFGGFVAFPGGKVAAADSLPNADPRRIAAVRELFEETGILIARHADGSFPRSGAELGGWRQRLIQETCTLRDVLDGLALAVCADDLDLTGRLVTPPFAATRFDTAFFVATLPPDQHIEVWPGELAGAEWITPVELLRRWTCGEWLVSPPTVMMMRALGDRPLTEAPGQLLPLTERVATSTVPPIPFSPGVDMIPLHTLPFAPGGHTNAFLVGTGPVYLIDPGSARPEEQQKLFTLLDEHHAAGRKLTAVVLTHHHPDHIGAATVCAQRYGVPIWAHSWTANHLRSKMPVARELGEGDRLELGTAPDGSGPWHLEPIHTPGHAPGHLAFYEPHYRLLFAGDMVSTLTSIIVAPPDGDLAVYLDSLRRLRELPCRLLLPSHGSPTARARQTIDQCLAHRAAREEQLVVALRTGPRTVAELVAELYQGIPDSLAKLAKLQTQAGLFKLQQEGRAELDAQQRWAATAG